MDGEPLFNGDKIYNLNSMDPDIEYTVRAAYLSAHPESGYTGDEVFWFSVQELEGGWEGSIGIGRISSDPKFGVRKIK